MREITGPKGARQQRIGEQRFEQARDELDHLSIDGSLALARTSERCCGDALARAFAFPGARRFERPGGEAVRRAAAVPARARGFVARVVAVACWPAPMLPLDDGGPSPLPRAGVLRSEPRPACWRAVRSALPGAAARRPDGRRPMTTAARRCDRCPARTPCASSRVDAAAAAFFSRPAATPAEVRRRIARWICDGDDGARARPRARSRRRAGRNGFDSAVTWLWPISVEVKVCSSRSSHSAVLSISCIAREISMSTSTRDSSISSRLQASPVASSRREPRCSSKLLGDLPAQRVDEGLLVERAPCLQRRDDVGVVDALAAARAASFDGPSSWIVPATTRPTRAGARASSSSTKRWRSGAIDMRAVAAECLDYLARPAREPVAARRCTRETRHEKGLPKQPLSTVRIEDPAGMITCPFRPCRPCRPCRRPCRRRAGRSLPSALRRPWLRWSASARRPRRRSAAPCA